MFFFVWKDSRHKSVDEKKGVRKQSKENADFFQA